ncbi:uncharacterized protein PV06_11701 [Exophiala oligosperma]|uniref:Ubiquitin 3 binding protein But2 C-terminal domain-containing protein n=1 Tax=Exophiala oligosperma TaxID=215243 RepID=A0A0D2A6N2_9EURO|nr:uncharacterized protein PV06_11701 [Exophiala oligosperma]KIW35981.1 hypothetical protein PV06_11701 [Exophiala oligosperma]
MHMKFAATVFIFMSSPVFGGPIRTGVNYPHPHTSDPNSNFSRYETNTTKHVLEWKREEPSFNAVFFAGTESLGFFLPQDGEIYNLGNIQCFEIPAVAVGECDGVSVSAVGIAQGTGPCTFYGFEGAVVTVADDKGALPVAPPQGIQQATCG